MGFLMKLALRNLWRNRRRTILTFSALSFGIACLIVVDSLMQGLAGMSEGNLIRLETGDIQIHAPGYFDERETFPLDVALKKQPVLDALQAVPQVLAASARIVTTARLNVGWEEFPVIAIAIDPVLDGRAMDLSQHIDGRMLNPGQREAVIGSGLAELLNLRIDDYITVVARTRLGAIEALDFIVTGRLYTPNPTVNQNHIYLPLDVMEQAFTMPEKVTGVVVRLKPGVSPQAAAGHIRTVLGEKGIQAEVFTWHQSAEEYVALIQTSRATDMMLIAVILIIALVGVTNTILLGTLERTGEIGTMKAMGMRDSHIVCLLLLEATGIALLAIGAGWVLGAVVNLYLVTVGVRVDSIIGDMDMGFPIGSVIYGTWNMPMYVWVAVIAIITCCVAGYMPARRAARLNAADAMRG